MFLATHVSRNLIACLVAISFPYRQRIRAGGRGQKTLVSRGLGEGLFAGKNPRDGPFYGDIILAVPNGLCYPYGNTGESTCLPCFYKTTFRTKKPLMPGLRLTSGPMAEFVRIVRLWAVPVG